MSISETEILDSQYGLEELTDLSDEEFASQWKDRYIVLRASMVTDVTRWLRLLRFYHPRALQDHWQDSFGVALPKLFKSAGLSVEIYNWCRPIIEVYCSLLAGQKPLPFSIDVPPSDAELESEVYRADSAEKILLEEMYRQKIPLHFQDFCASVCIFGIGYVMSWVHPKTKRLCTQAIPWPGDVLPLWGSDRYGSGAEGMEACIIQERLPLEGAIRKYPKIEFVGNMPDLTTRPEGTYDIIPQSMKKTVHILKVWYRWTNSVEQDKIGYAEIAYQGAKTEGDNGANPKVLYRMDDTGYPDIPVKWAARFATPGEAPHHSAGVLDDVIGVNTEYNEKLSAFSDMIMKTVYTKYKGKGMTSSTTPKLGPGTNIYPLAANQDLTPLIEQVNQIPFDSFLTRLETHMLTVAGLSRLMMGSLPPGETSGEALMNLLHAAIGRLEVIRTPIQWAWQSMFTDVWVPLLIDFSKFEAVDTMTKRRKFVSLKTLFEGIHHIDWQWPDVTPRDALHASENAMNLAKGGWLSDEGVMKRANIASPIDELNKIKKQRGDKIMHPEAVGATMQITMQEQQMQNPQQAAPVKTVLSGKLTPEQEQAAAGMQGFTGQPPNQIQDMQNKAQAAQTPTLGAENNQQNPATPQNGFKNKRPGKRA